jgi:hypothetical protein
MHTLHATYPTACGGTIAIPAKAQAHLLAHPDVSAHLGAAIAKIRLPVSDFLRAEVDMGRIIGPNGRISTPVISLDDPALFALRLGRDKPSRVAPLDTTGPNTTYLSVLAFPSRSSHRQYVCATAWIGRLAEKEPWDPQIRSESERIACLAFWSSHALIYDSTVMSPPFSSTWRQVINAETARAA